MITYREGSGACRFGVEVVASVLDHETKIQVPCKVQCELHLRDIAYIHRIRRIGAQRAVVIIWEDFWRET